MTAIAWCQRTHATPQKGKHAYFTVIYSVLSRPKDVASNHYIELRAIFAGICGVFFASSLPTMAHFWARTDLQIWNSGRPPPPRPPPPNDLCQQLPALLRFPSSFGIHQTSHECSRVSYPLYSCLLKLQHRKQIGEGPIHFWHWWHVHETFHLQSKYQNSNKSSSRLC